MYPANGMGNRNKSAQIAVIGIAAANAERHGEAALTGGPSAAEPSVDAATA